MTKINEQTTVNIGLVLLVISAFYSLGAFISHVNAKDAQHDGAIEEIKSGQNEIVKELKEINKTLHKIGD